MRHFRFAGVVLAVCIILLPISAHAASLAFLNGWWSGSGSVTFGEGKAESFRRCRGTGIAQSGGAVKVAMRCSNASTSIEVICILRGSGQVRGQCEEKKFNKKGTFLGTLRGTGISGVLRADGKPFRVQLSRNARRLIVNMSGDGIRIHASLFHGGS